MLVSQVLTHFTNLDFSRAKGTLSFDIDEEIKWLSIQKGVNVMDIIGKVESTI